MILLCIAAAGVPAARGAESLALDQATAESVQRAIPYLQKEGASWIEKRGCVSCHQVPFMLWSLASAQANGFDVDLDQLRKWQDWSVQVASFVKPEQKADVDVDKTLSSNIDTMHALLLAIDHDQVSRGISEDSDESWRESFASALVANQNADGTWNPCGQLPMQKRPKRETTQVTTLWTLIALAGQDIDSYNRDAALGQTENEQPVSTEWWVARLLLAQTRDEKTTNSLRGNLVSMQHSDGGWGWLSSEPSDALATGMALYAIRKTADAPGSNQESGANRESNANQESDTHQESIDAAIRFLVSTQSDDGSWRVPGTKQTTRKKPTPTSNYWGTAWAVIGLLE